MSRKYKEDPVRIFYSIGTKSWLQKLFDINLLIRDLNLDKNEIIIPPNEIPFSFQIIEYYPGQNPEGLVNGIDAWLYLDQLPYTEFLKNLYEYFYISTVKGERIINLNNMEHWIQKKETYITIYYIEISIDDLLNF